MSGTSRLPAPSAPAVLLKGCVHAYRYTLRGVIGALVAFVSFGGVMLATRLGRVGEVAALRETSTVFAAVIGWAVLGEKVGMLRAALMGLIALGAVLVQIG